jgi:hypothetical protein
MVKNKPSSRYDTLGLTCEQADIESLVKGLTKQYGSQARDIFREYSGLICCRCGVAFAGPVREGGKSSSISPRATIIDWSKDDTPNAPNPFNPGRDNVDCPESSEAVAGWHVHHVTAGPSQADQNAANGAGMPFYGGEPDDSIFRLDPGNLTPSPVPIAR